MSSASRAATATPELFGPSHVGMFDPSVDAEDALAGTVATWLERQRGASSRLPHRFPRTHDGACGANRPLVAPPGARADLLHRPTRAWLTRRWSMNSPRPGKRRRKRRSSGMIEGYVTRGGGHGY